MTWRLPGSSRDPTATNDWYLAAQSRDFRCRAASWLIDFTLAGVPYQILDAGPMFTLTEAVSISVETDDQAETDRLWAALTTNGGEESHCGWLKDRYGVSWQVFPRRLTELTLKADKNVSAKAIAAMMKQKKIDIAEIEAAVRA